MGTELPGEASKFTCSECGKRYLISPLARQCERDDKKLLEEP
jgi:hypothetical protein